MSVTVPGLGLRDPLTCDAARESAEAFDAAVRARAADPLVRKVMATLNEVFAGDGYGEDEEGFRWLVVDASRVVACVEVGREANPDFVPDDAAFIFDALVDSGRWDPDEPLPWDILGPLEAAVSGSRDGER